MELERDPDVRWVDRLAGRGSGAAERAIAEAEGRRDLFRHLVREHRRSGRESYGEIAAPLELHALVRLTSPLHVLEVGVSSGVSSAYILAALEKNGRGTLHSIDLPSKPRAPTVTGRLPRSSWSLPAGRSTGWAVPFPLRKRWDLRLGDKVDVLPLLADELPSVGLFVYDVPHDDRIARGEFRRIDRLLPPGGIAIVDHGPGGGLCPSLRSWGRERGTVPVGRARSGLYGIRVS